MIAINKLYGVLLGMATDDIPATYKWYAKKFTTVATSEKVQNILKIMLQTVSIDKRAMFACIICNAVLHTIFGKEIEKLDPVNTYVPVTRPPDSANDNPNFCLLSMAGPADMYKPMKQFLDQDILDRLETPSWMEYIAAGCLQILRELKK